MKINNKDHMDQIIGEIKNKVNHVKYSQVICALDEHQGNL